MAPSLSRDLHHKLSELQARAPAEITFRRGPAPLRCRKAFATCASDHPHIAPLLRGAHSHIPKGCTRLRLVLL